MTHFEYKTTNNINDTPIKIKKTQHYVNYNYAYIYLPNKKRDTEHLI